MSNSCLVTKLKGSVNNPDLPVFDSIRISIGNVSGELNFTCAAANKTFILKTADGSAKIATSKSDADSDIFVSEVTVSTVYGQGLQSRFWVKKPNCDFLIVGKGNIRSFYNSFYMEGQAINGVKFTIDGGDIKYLTDLILRPRAGMIYKGSLDNLYNLDFTTPVSGQFFLSFRGSTFVDDNDFSKLGNIIRLPANADFGQNLRETNLIGSIEKFVANYRKAHSSTSSGRVKFEQMYQDESTIITYNGSKINVGTTDNVWTWATNATDSTHTDITHGSVTKTIDADGNDVVVA